MRSHRAAHRDTARANAKFQELTGIFCGLYGYDNDQADEQQCGLYSSFAHLRELDSLFDGFVTLLRDNPRKVHSVGDFLAVIVATIPDHSSVVCRRARSVHVAFVLIVLKPCRF